MNDYSLVNPLKEATSYTNEHEFLSGGFASWRGFFSVDLLITFYWLLVTDN